MTTAIVAVALAVVMASVAHHYGLLDKLVKNIGFAVPLVLTLIAIVASAWADRRYAGTARLVVDERGIRLKSELRSLGGLSSWESWDVPWDDVERVIAMDRVGVIHIRRKPGGFRRAIVLRPIDWIDDSPAAEWGAQKPKLSDTRSTGVWRALDEAGLFARGGAGSSSLEFDLLRHPATRAILIVAGLLVLYAGADSVLQREAWVEASVQYYLPHVIAGSLAAGGAAAWLAMSRAPRSVPPLIVAVLAVTLGTSAGVASWFALLRVNQLAGGPLVEQAYVRNAACNTLLPVEPGLPPIEYTDLAAGYWCTFSEDHRHVVPLRRGLGGLYQVDLTEHTKAIREFRESPPVRKSVTM